MEIKIIGLPVCPKCNTTYSLFDKVIKENNLDVTLTKVNSLKEVIKLGIRTIPVIMIDGDIKTKGEVTSIVDIKRLLNIE